MNLLDLIQSEAVIIGNKEKINPYNNDYSTIQVMLKITTKSGIFFPVQIQRIFKWILFVFLH